MISFKRIISELVKLQMTSEQYINLLRKKGVQIGGGGRFFDPKTTYVDTQNPFMVKIGNNVRITRGVIILTHDYSWSVLAGLYGEILGGIGPVEIGNNVFIGMNSIILKNTIIGDNVIIGAGSVVSGNLEPYSVYAGSPARKIMSLDTFYKKRKKKKKNDIERIKDMYRDAYSIDPPLNVLREYFWSFADRKQPLNKDYEGLIRRTGYFKKILDNFYNNT